jgi:hypothetical protein
MREWLIEKLIDRYRKPLSKIVPKIHPYPIDRWVYRVQLNHQQGWHKPETLEEQYPDLQLPKGMNRMEPNSKELVRDNLPMYQPYSGVIKCVPLYQGRGGMMGPAEWTLVFYSQEDANMAMNGKTIHDLDHGPSEQQQQWGAFCERWWRRLSVAGILLIVPLWWLLGIYMLPLLGLPPLVLYYLIGRVYEWGSEE